MVKVDIFDDSFHTLMDTKQDPVLVAEGFSFTEGPIWHGKEKHLTFTDFPNNRIYRWSESGGTRIIKEMSNKSNGLVYDHLGRILACEGTTSRVARMDADMSNYEVLATHYQDKQLNSPNDIILHSNGMIYFTDPQFGRRPTGAGLGRPQELDFQGIYMLNPDTLLLTLVEDKVSNPNGLCLSLDEKKMYVADTPRHCILVFDILSDGKLANMLTFGVVSNKGDGKPDGVKIDVEENVWCTAQGGVQVFNRGGRLLAAIQFEERSGNLCFGGDDLKSLFVCSGTKVFSLRCKIPGQKLKI